MIDELKHVCAVSMRKRRTSAKLKEEEIFGPEGGKG